MLTDGRRGGAPQLCVECFRLRPICWKWRGEEHLEVLLRRISSESKTQVSHFRVAANLNENMNPLASVIVVVPTSPGENYFMHANSDWVNGMP
jgi:hypothetical protein